MTCLIDVTDQSHASNALRYCKTNLLHTNVTLHMNCATARPTFCTRSIDAAFFSFATCESSRSARVLFNTSESRFVTRRQAAHASEFSSPAVAAAAVGTANASRGHVSTILRAVPPVRQSHVLPSNAPTSNSIKKSHDF
eukprot:2136068-Pleurochrysis_carterae.AAC.1